MSELGAASGTTQYSYRVNDSLQQLTAPNAVATGYATDDLGNAVSETSPDRGSQSYAHDAAGNLTSRVRPTGTDSFSYDALNRPLTRNHPGTGQDVSFTYESGNCPNGIGRLCSIVHEAGTTGYEYDAFGNVTRKLETLSGVAYTTLYAWDKDDRLAQITYPTGQVVAYGRDPQGRIQSVTLDGASIVSSRSTRGDGLLLSQTYGNGLAETRTYNGLGLLATYALGAVENETYGYDLAGNLTSRSGSSWSLGYGYDAIDRLTSDTGGSGNRSYGYDPNGNRQSKTVNGSPTAYTYTSGTNRLATVGGSTVTLDTEGRSTVVPSYKYSWSNAGRLLTVKKNNKTVGTYVYDASGLRRRKVAGNVTTIYHFDESGHLLAETNAAGVMQRLYVWAGAAPIAQKVGSTLTYLHADHLDTPRWGTSPAGALVWRWRSDGFGEALPEEDVDGNGTNVSVNLRFPGQVYDAESGLHQNWFRDYTPGYGRYAQSDPIGLVGGVNVYAYVDGDPVGQIDPLGLEAIAWLAQNGWPNPAPEGVLSDASQIAADAAAFATSLPRGTHPAQGDAIQHCVASCELKKRHGDEVASVLGTANEWARSAQGRQSRGDKVMDDFNNQVGRDLAAECPPPDCRQGCLDAWSSGRLTSGGYGGDTFSAPWGGSE